jgi:serine/threonine-protein kinase
LEALKAIEVPSRRYGKYTLRSRIGQGGQAEIYLAEAVDEHGEHVNVALKLAKKGDAELKLADEADLMSMLVHPNLVKLIEVGTAFGRPFIAMEFLIGGDLAEVMNALRQQMTGCPLKMGVHVVIELLKALSYVHRATTRTGQAMHLVHSDVNPANVFFSGSGEVKLGDFGVANSSRLDLGPGEGVAAGKLWYLSPEQCRGETVGQQSDLWAAGVILHELVVGYHPFKKDDASDAKAMELITQGKLDIPDYVDAPLKAVVQKALAVDLGRRYQTAGQFGGDLFGYALDQGLFTTNAEVQEWLEGLLGILV